MLFINCASGEEFVMNLDDRSLSESEKEVAFLLAGGKVLPQKKRPGRGRSPKFSKVPNPEEVTKKAVERKRKPVRIPRDPHQIPHQITWPVRANNYLHANDMLRIGALIPGCEPLAESPKSVIYKTRDYILHLERELDTMKKRMSDSIAGSSLKLPPLQDMNLREGQALSPS